MIGLLLVKLFHPCSDPGQAPGFLVQVAQVGKLPLPVQNGDLIVPILPYGFQLQVPALPEGAVEILVHGELPVVIFLPFLRFGADPDHGVAVSLEDLRIDFPDRLLIRVQLYGVVFRLLVLQFHIARGESFPAFRFHIAHNRFQGPEAQGVDLAVLQQQDRDALRVAVDHHADLAQIEHAAAVMFSQGLISVHAQDLFAGLHLIQFLHVVRPRDVDAELRRQGFVVILALEPRALDAHHAQAVHIGVQQGSVHAVVGAHRLQHIGCHPGPVEIRIADRQRQVVAFPLKGPASVHIVVAGNRQRDAVPFQRLRKINPLKILAVQSLHLAVGGPLSRQHVKNAFDRVRLLREGCLTKRKAQDHQKRGNAFYGSPHGMISSLIHF